MVSTDALIAKVNRELGIHGAEFVASGLSNTPNPTRIEGSISGKAVRIEFAINSEHPDYDYTVWVYESGSGAAVGRGNGGASFEEAIENYQWNNVLVDLDIELR
jgi:hypothetical protein